MKYSGDFEKKCEKFFLSKSQINVEECDLSGGMKSFHLTREAEKALTFFWI